MNIVLIAQDNGPSEALNLLAEELVSRSHVVYPFLAYGKTGTDESALEDIVQDADFVVCGMSSSATLSHEEIAAARMALGYSVPLGFFSDTFGSWNRDWFTKELERASLLFAVNRQEREEARLRFPNLNVVAAVNPCWEKFYAFEHDRSAVRAALGVENDVKLILSPGKKIAAVNIVLWSNLVEACWIMADCQILLSPHPGDRTPLGIYADLIKFCAVPTRIVTAAEMPTSQTLCGCDLVVEFASSIGIEAACKRIPVIDFFTPLLLKNLEMEHGTKNWPLCTSRSAITTDGVIGLQEQIGRILYNNEERELNRQAQERALPDRLETELAAGTMASSIEKAACK